MTALEALVELLARVGASQNVSVAITEVELSRWPALAVHELKTKLLLTKASPSASTVCPGCEQQCTMPVIFPAADKNASAAFVLCDKRDDTNRVRVPAEQLRQWKCGAEAVGVFVAQCLGLQAGAPRTIGDGLWELGLVRGTKRSQMICLRANGVLELVVGRNQVPLADLVRFEDEGYAVDATIIRQFADTANTGDSRYTPSNARQEARKLSTKDLHESWRRAYRELKKRRPEMSDVWHSQQIAKQTISAGRSAETIRKHMTR
jgi:hypothetical protein